MDFRFTTEIPASRTDEVVDYLLGPRLLIPKGDYPDMVYWAGKVHGQLRSEAKRAMVALDKDEIVGVTIFQRHLSDSEVLEIKNLTVRPDHRGRLIASFLLRNTEIEAWQEFGSRHVVCDAKVRNFGIRQFLFKQGYRVVGQEDLYGLDAGLDVIYRKPLENLSLQFPRAA